MISYLLNSAQLAVSDSKLANAIKDKLSIKCVNDSGVMELMRGIRGQLDGLLTSVGDENLRAMRLGLSHSLSRYKLKFSADKVRFPLPLPFATRIKCTDMRDIAP